METALKGNLPVSNEELSLLSDLLNNRTPKWDSVDVDRLREKIVILKRLLTKANSQEKVS